MTDSKQASLPRVVDEKEAMAALKDENGRVVPTTVVQKSINQRIDTAVHAILDAKPPERIQAELEDVDIEKWSRVLSRLYQRKDVKVDHTITAMGLLALFPVVRDEP